MDDVKGYFVSKFLVLSHLIYAAIDHFGSAADQEFLRPIFQKAMKMKTIWPLRDGGWRGMIFNVRSVNT